MVDSNDKSEDKVELSTKAQFAKLLLGTTAAFLVTKLVDTAFDKYSLRQANETADTDQ